MERANARISEVLQNMGKPIRPSLKSISRKQLTKLAQAAWACREKAFVLGNTKVGTAVLSSDRRIFVGCNVEHRFRCHDVHAEVNAITSMVAAGATQLVAVVIVADRKRFTPCGGCMDWIMQFGSQGTIIAFQARRGGRLLVYTAKRLMPFYPG